MELLLQALTQFETLGAGPDAARIRERLKTLGWRASPTES
jgi:hypothetical protein